MRGPFGILLLMLVIAAAGFALGYWLGM